MLLVVEFEVLPELPSTTLLLPSGGGVMREVGVGVVVEEAGHRDGDGVWLATVGRCAELLSAHGLSSKLWSQVPS